MSKPKRPSTTTRTFGLYRRRPQGKGEAKRNVGAFILDIRIKDVPEFAGIPKRIAKSTEVFPGDRGADQLVREMKAMVKELIRNRDAETLRRIQDGSLSVRSAYTKWKTGRLHLAYGFEGEKLLKLWREHYAKSPFALATKKSREGMLNAVVSHGLLTEDHVVNDLPEVIARVRDHYGQRKRSVQFNAFRFEAIAFAKRKLRVDDSSPFLHAIRKTEPLKLFDRRDHHPIDTPRALRQFIESIEARKTIPTPARRAYQSAVLFMCLHSLRPEEFSHRQFEIDKHTGHLRIHGSKNPNAKRIVPLMMKLETNDQLPRGTAMNAVFKRLGSPIRCRDFRRTFALWGEKAGLPANRLRVYMGHADTMMTHLYQRQKPTKEMLDEDRERFERWFNEEWTKPIKEAREVKPIRASSLIGKPFPSSQNLRALARSVQSEWESDKHGPSDGSEDED